MPMSNSNASVSFNIQGRPVAKGDEPDESVGLVMPGYFETMRIPLLSGRLYADQNLKLTPPRTISGSRRS